MPGQIFSRDTTAAVLRYNIDIVNSAAWRKLQKYDQLCSALDLHIHQLQLRKSQKRFNTNTTNDTATEGPEQPPLRDNQPRSSKTAKPKSKLKRRVQGQHKTQLQTMLSYMKSTSRAAVSETTLETQEQPYNDKTIESGQDNNNSRKRTTHPISTDEAQKRQRQQDNDEDDQDSRLRIADLAGEADDSTDDIAHSHSIANDVNFVYRSPCVVQVERQI